MSSLAGCRAHGIDQGYHNYLLHTGRFGSSTVVLEYGKGPVLTVGAPCAAGELTPPHQV
jgi:hypothetical protein